jgi:hypothetical protein
MVSHLGCCASASPVFNAVTSLPISVREQDIGMWCKSSFAEGESRYSVVTPGMSCGNWEILLLCGVTCTVSMVVNLRWFVGLPYTYRMSVALRTATMPSLMAITEVLRGQLSLFIMQLHFPMVGLFLLDGAFLIG